MDTFEINKILGAVLGSLLALMVINLIGNVLVSDTHPEAPAIAIALPEGAKRGEHGAQAAATAEPEKPLAALLAEADPEKGAKQAKKCMTCHTFEAGGANKIGPNLHSIVGRARASVEGFGYSDAMKEKGGEWSYEDLNHFLADPKGFLPGTKMAFAGVKKDADRADVILYLRQQTDSPPPLPTE